MIVAGFAPAQAATVVPHFYVAYGDRPGDVIAARALPELTPFLRPAAIPFAPSVTLRPPPEPTLPTAAPYRIDPAMSPADQMRLRRIAEGLRLSRTGRLLYAYLAKQFLGRGSVSFKLESMGQAGDRAVVSGTPPHYVVSLNRDLVERFGEESMVPKLAHEIVHVYDYERGVQRSVSMEVSGHATDATVAYEASMATTGKPISRYTSQTSVRPLYELRYIAFRRKPTLAAYQSYWRELMTLVAYERSYRNYYRDAAGEITWNSPPGPAGPGTYVPFDPTYGLP